MKKQIVWASNHPSEIEQEGELISLTSEGLFKVRFQFGFIMTFRYIRKPVSFWCACS